MERDLNFTVTDGRRDDSVRVNGGISEYAEVRSRTAEIIPPSRYSGNRSSFVLSSLGQRFSLCKDGI